MISIFKPKTSVLLALLVITGLAGRPSFDTISGAERRFLTQHLKESKAELVKSIRGLSEEQLNYKSGPDEWSIKECVQHLAVSENELWEKAETALNQPENGEKRREIRITDEELLKAFSDGSLKLEASKVLQPEKSSFKATEDALQEFKKSRNKLIKFAKSTTDNLRNHVIPTQAGASDVYQLVLMISAHTQQHINQIEEIKQDKGFPKP